MKQKISKDLMKLYNQKLLLRIIKEKGPISRSDLSKITGLTLPAISEITKELESLYLINNIGETRITRGRFPSMYQLNGDAFKVIGVTIRSHSIRVGLINLVGDILYYEEQYQSSNTKPEVMADAVSSIVDRVLHETKTQRHEVRGIGLGMHGIVDAVNGISIYPPHLKWENVAIRDLLEERIHFPVLVDNDCNTLALAEYWYGGGRSLNSFITLNVDYGIGAGIIVDGNIFHGRDFGAGQIGHTVVSDNGPLCSCGKYGCLEAMSSENSIVENIQRKVKQGYHSSITHIESDPDKINIHHIYKAAATGDELTLNTLNHAAHYLGIGISMLVNLFNPEKVIVTGGVIRSKDIVLDTLNETFNMHALKTNVKHFELVTSKLGQKADVLGAGTLWINEIFKGDTTLTDLLNLASINN
ncbi:ROK family transcriptional regulator [Neobacillus jeddahensis]|uniref:ROK family transcriptional regulator n=1 Tax=Neobacillus jeddahensis TaxID=1461580 RepID=UPI00058BBA25|nr:ROK family transcriptional regulator [Neobacillus jeddahensis]